jgi:WD40 repeat protein
MASRLQTISVWNVTTGQQIGTLRGHKNLVTSLAWCKDDRRLASASEDGTVKIWDATERQDYQVLPAHSGSVVVVHWYSDSRRLVTIGADHRDGQKHWCYRVWDGTTGTHLSSLAKFQELPDPLAFSPDGRRFAGVMRTPNAPDMRLVAWDTASGKELFSFLDPTGSLEVGLAWSPNGKRLAVSGCFGDHTVKIFAIDEGRQVGGLAGNQFATSVLAWSPDGKRLALAKRVNDRSVIAVWDTASEQEIQVLPCRVRFAFSALSWSPDGRRLAALSPSYRAWPEVPGHGPSVAERQAHNESSKEIALFDLTTGQEMPSLRGHADKIWSVLWSPDGARLASASADKTIKIWDWSSGEAVLTLPQETNPYPPQALAWSPDGKRLAAIPWFGGGRVFIYDGCARGVWHPSLAASQNAQAPPKSR